jgi:hypothetical protein
VARLLVAAAMISGVIASGCDDEDDTSERPTLETRLTPSQSSERASRSAVEVSVAPATGRRMSVIRVSFESGVRLGATRDKRRRGYYVVAKRLKGMSGCVQHREAYVDRGRAGQRVVAAIDPRRGKGGDLGWCRGRFRGVLHYYDGFACPRTGRCRSPAGFEKLNRVVAKFRFRIE